MPTLTCGAYMLEPSAENTLKTNPSVISKVQRDDEEGWVRFYDIYQPFLYSACRSAGLSHEASQDVVQETMLTVRRHVASFIPDEHRGRFLTWLRTILRSRLVDHYRRNQRNPLQMTAGPKTEAANDQTCTSTLNRVPAPTEAELDSLIDRKLQEEVLAEATRRVKATVRMEDFQAYDLFELQQLSAGEVASCLGINPVTVRVRAFRVRKAIGREARRLMKEFESFHHLPDSNV